MRAPHRLPCATLAQVAPGESARIGHVLFGALRSLCAELGLREGVEVKCRARSSGVLVLETRAGSVVALARDSARYIRVDLLTTRLEPAG